MKIHIKILCVALAVIMVLGAFSLAACVYEPVYRVTFDYGYDNIKHSVTIKRTEKLEMPDQPEREGYEFIGWFDKDEQEFEFGQILNGNIVLYAYWIEIEYETPIIETTTDTLSIASGDFDGVFSPFFATSGSDMKVAEQTQINMLWVDPVARPTVGEDVPSAVKDYKNTTYVRGVVDTDGSKGAMLTETERKNGDIYWTDYEFLIKNGIKFSDGSDLTIKDVLFNMYVYLDPAYDGGNTMYSVNIKGLDKYRRQDPMDNGSWQAKHENYAVAKRDNIYRYFFYDAGKPGNGQVERAQYRNAVFKSTVAEKNIIDDVQFIRQEFWKEIVADYKSAAATDFGQVTQDKPFGDTNPYAEEMFTKPWEVFMYMYDFIIVNRGKTGEILVDPQGAAGGGKYDPRDGKWKQIYYNSCENYSHDPLDMMKVAYNSIFGIVGGDGDLTRLDGVEIDWVINDAAYKEARKSLTVNDIANSDYSKLVSYINNLRFIDNKYQIYEMAWDDNNGNYIIDFACLDDTRYIVGRLRSNLYGERVLSNIKNVFHYYATGQSVMESWVNMSIAAEIENSKAGNRYIVETVSGINVEQVNTFNGKDLTAEHYVLKVSIVGVDPTAIHKFNFAIAPMKYYSDPTGKSGGFQLADDGYANFNYRGVAEYDEEKPIRMGFKQFSRDYFSRVFKDENVIRLPKGAGPYKFQNLNDCHLVANDYFYTTGEKMTNPAIKYLCYRVIDTSKVMENLVAGDINYANVQPTKKNIDAVKKNSHLQGDLTDNLGYGYVGINAKYIQNINIRKIIMTAMDTRMILNYYAPDMAQIITRPMVSNSVAYPQNSWAYPEGAVNDVYPFINEANVVSKINSYLAAFGNNIRKDSNDKWEILEGGQWKKLKYTFTIASAETDHPAYAMFLNAARILNNNGFIINVLPDPLAYSKLLAGTLHVWAAERAPSIDSDIYQTYHKDSKASVVRGWGYPYMQQDNPGNFYTELSTIDEISKCIDDGRATMDQARRERKYMDALNKVMSLAVEYPLYQRKNYIVYNIAQLNPQSFSDLLRTYDPTYKIWKLKSY